MKGASKLLEVLDRIPMPEKQNNMKKKKKKNVNSRVPTRFHLVPLYITLNIWSLKFIICLVQ